MRTMRRLVTIAAVVGAVSAVSCSSAPATGGAVACTVATTAYQERVAFVYPYDGFKLSAAYKALSPAEQAAYDQGTAEALDASNTACGTGGASS